MKRFLPAIVFGVALPAVAARAAARFADAWAGLVGLDRAAVVKQVGDPSLEFSTVLVETDQPLQVTPSGDMPTFDEAAKMPPRASVHVLQYTGGEAGMDYQVVFKGEKVAWAVTPPAADERTSTAVMKKYGKTDATPGDVMHADILRHWEVLAYPKKGVAFVRHPGESAIVARVLQPAKAQ
ncbi:MAG TPA: hypothetical protein VMV18_13885 [bacterium]|nr:hypothetical protein [bacterium]